jgi:hypothetical protein
MERIVYAVGGALLGAVLRATYDRQVQRKRRRGLRNMLMRELEWNAAQLRALGVTLDAYRNTELPEYIDPLSFDEIANRVERACQRDLFSRCLPELSSLGAERMSKVLEFYESARQLPETIRQVSRWAGNVRATFFDENLRALIQHAEDAIAGLAASRVSGSKQPRTMSLAG